MKKVICVILLFLFLIGCDLHKYNMTEDKCTIICEERNLRYSSSNSVGDCCCVYVPTDISEIIRNKTVRLKEINVGYQPSENQCGYIEIRRHKNKGD